MEKTIERKREMSLTPLARKRPKTEDALGIMSNWFYRLSIAGKRFFLEQGSMIDNDATNMKTVVRLLLFARENN